MPRPKVDPRARQRVAKACLNCKSSKQKCDGQIPCSLCTRRGREASCTFGDTGSKTARSENISQRATGSVTSSRHVVSPLLSIKTAISNRDTNSPRNTVAADKTSTTPAAGVVMDHEETRASSVSGNEVPDSNETLAPVPKSIRMLRDSKGKLMYIGDSAALSFLQTIRRLVQNTIGPTRFTADPLRHFMLEHTIPTHSSSLEPQDFPDIFYAKGAAEAYFASTSGLLDLFDVPQFQEDLQDWINGFFANNTPTSAIFYLVMAIGAQNRATHALDDRRSKLYFDHGRQLACLGLMEDPSMATIQAFTLMTFYMLAACRRNGAYLNLGIAARAAYSMGLHRQAANAALEHIDGALRGRIWKSLRLLDLIISSTLGRPSATSDNESDLIYEHYTPKDSSDPQTLPILALSESIRVFLIVEKIGTKVYKHKTISVQVAESIASQLREWSSNLPRELRESSTTQGSSGIESQGLVLAKANVAFGYYYAMMLLMRPFLIFHLKSRLDPESAAASGQSNVLSSALNSEKSADACIDSAVYMLDLMHKLLRSQMLFKNMTIMIAWVFGAGLVVGLAHFGGLGNKEETERSLKYSIAICHHFSANSAQAQRYHHIITGLQEACAQYHSILKQSGPIIQKKLVSRIFELGDSSAKASSTNLNWTQSESRANDTMEEMSPSHLDLFGSIMEPNIMFTTSGDLVLNSTEGQDFSEMNLSGEGESGEGYSSAYDHLLQHDPNKKAPTKLPDYGQLFGVHAGESEQFDWEAS